MFGRKGNPPAPSRPTGKRNLSQFGLMDIPDLDNMDDMGDLSDNDDALEAELLALTSTGADVPKQRKQSRAPVDQSNLDRMIQASLRDIPSDEDVSSGEDDPSILAELQELQVDSADTVREVEVLATSGSDALKSLLMDRIRMYETAEQNAMSVNEVSKARRMNRGLTKLNELLKQVNSGRNINENDIPPTVSIGAPKPAPSAPAQIAQNENPNHELPPASPPADPVAQEAPPIPPRLKHAAPSSNDSNDEPELKIQARNDTDRSEDVKSERETGVHNFDIIKQRQDEYKKAAVEAKKSGDIQSALSYVKIVKQFDLMMNAVKEGAVVDLSSIPPSLNCAPESNAAIHTTKSPTSLQKQDSTRLTSSSPQRPPIPAAAPYVPPKTVIEALEQRLKKFQESEEAAKNENNASKARRIGRIVQQYKDAIRLHKAGKAIPVDDLPTPPGFAPIPMNDAPSQPGPSTPSKPPVVLLPAAEKKSPQPASAPLPEKNRSAGAVSRNDQQLQAVLERQKLFKVAALKAKQSGDIEMAKEYLRTAKGFDPMIEASKCGLPVDLTTLPLPPNDKALLESSYEVVRLNDCIEGSDLDVYHKLQTDLRQQLEMCMRTRDHFKAMGDVANANRLEQLALQTKKDLKFVQLAENSNLRVPKFHYETKPFTIVQCNTDLTDNDLELCIVQGINYNVPNPKEVDTYVKVHFPYPAEAPPQFKTSVIYNTNNPVYNATTTFPIQRNSRACRRIFLRQAVKFEVWSKGGFFRSDTLIGTVNAKLIPLETHCTVHDAFDLMDGRKMVGGKLELKMRIRDPIVKKQVEHVEEKWLIIDT